MHYLEEWYHFTDLLIGQNLKLPKPQGFDSARSQAALGARKQPFEGLKGLEGHVDQGPQGMSRSLDIGWVS
jgi:hypothetical protein